MKSNMTSVRIIGSEKRNLTPPKKLAMEKLLARRLVDCGSFEQNDGEGSGDVKQCVEQIGVPRAHPRQGQSSQHRSDEMRSLGNTGVERHGVRQMRARHEMGDQRHPSRVED